MMRWVFTGLGVAVAGCATTDLDDADGDGFGAAVDCDDEAPLVYPGALETKGDGVDSDCDGQDPPYAFLGAWELVDYAASIGGYPIFEDVPYSGEMQIEEGLRAMMTVEFEAYSLQLPAELEGTASPLPGEDTFNLELSGIFAPGLQDSPASADLDCDVWDSEVVCDGALLILGYNVLASFGFDARE